MDLSQILHALGRRWYVLIAGLLVTAGFVVLALRFVPLTYDVKTSILLLPPTSSVTQTGNPFLNLGGLDVVAGVLGRSVTDSESTQAIIPPGSKAKYTVQQDASVSGSVLQVQASDTTPAGAFRVLNAVVVLATAKLTSLQDEVNAKPSDQVRLLVITNNTVATPDYASLIRLLILVVAVGIVLTLFAAVLIDAVVRRRRSRRRERRGPPGEEAQQAVAADEEPGTVAAEPGTVAAEPEPRAAETETIQPLEPSADAEADEEEFDSVQLTRGRK